MSKGWISVHRKLQCHWLWMDKPFSKGQAWIDLLMSANHEDGKFLLGGQLVEVNKGDVVTSEVKLMDRWGWSKTKVRTFLEMLENDSMIVKKADNKKTTLTIVNYGVWQDSQTAKEPQKDFKKTSKELQKDTINNSNNSNNPNKDIYTPDESEILSFWNSKDIIKHTESEAIKKEIAKALKKPGKEKVILGITQYSTLLHDSDFYYSHKFTLINFLKQKNGLPNFLDGGQIWANYLAKNKKEVKPSEVISGDSWKNDPYLQKLGYK